MNGTNGSYVVRPNKARTTRGNREYKAATKYCHDANEKKQEYRK